MRKRIEKSFFISARELLITRDIPFWDFHIHTNYTDGKASVHQVFEKAIEADLQTIIFTEHTEPWRAKQNNWFTGYCTEIERYRLIYAEKIRVFIGLEANAISFNGDVELTDEMKEKAEFILGAAHRYPELGNRKVSDLSKQEAIELEYKTLIGLATNKEIDAIAHIGATCTKYCTPFPKELSREIIKTAVKNNIAIEVNPIYHKPLDDFIKLCAEENALVTLGSNAHGFNDIGLIVKELQKKLLND